MNKDVNIVGEKAQSYRTTILGGFSTITGTQRVRSTIRGIDFEGPIWDAIVIGASTGSVIADNVIRNVVPVKIQVPSGRIITFAEGIGFSGYDSSGLAPQLITGNVIIARNTIDGARAVFSNGIQLDSISAKVEIVGNRIVNVNDDTTETGSGILVIRAENDVLLADNFIAPGPTQNYGADGIFIGGDDVARFEVIGNSIHLTGPLADGIDAAGGDPNSNSGILEADVVGNSIEMNGANAYGIFLWDLVTKSRISENSIEGGGAFALGISTYGFDTNIASLNRFIDNDLHAFTANQADLFYDTNSQNNREVGFCRSVIDLGTGNSSTCRAGASSTGAPNAAAARSINVSAASGLVATKRQQMQLQQAFGRIAPGQVVR